MLSRSFLAPGLGSGRQAALDLAPAAHAPFRSHRLRSWELPTKIHSTEVAKGIDPLKKDEEKCPRNHATNTGPCSTKSERTIS